MFDVLLLRRVQCRLGPITGVPDHKGLPGRGGLQSSLLCQAGAHDLLHSCLESFGRVALLAGYKLVPDIGQDVHQILESVLLHGDGCQRCILTGGLVLG